MEAQWIYNPRQVKQPLPACWGMKERERAKKKRKKEPESLWELSHVVWDSLSTTEEGKMRGAEHPEVRWNSSPCRMDSKATRCSGVRLQCTRVEVTEALSDNGSVLPAQIRSPPSTTVALFAAPSWRLQPICFSAFICHWRLLLLTAESSSNLKLKRHPASEFTSWPSYTWTSSFFLVAIKGETFLPKKKNGKTLAVKQPQFSLLAHT